MSPPSGRRRTTGGFKAKPDSVGAQRLRATAAQGKVVDKRLWTGIAQLVGGGHNSTALVGTPEQVADALLDYYDLGVRNFLIRGFDPLNDAQEYGKALLPITREKKPRCAPWRSVHRESSPNRRLATAACRDPPTDGGRGGQP